MSIEKNTSESEKEIYFTHALLSIIPDEEKEGYKGKVQFLDDEGQEQCQRSFSAPDLIRVNREVICNIVMQLLPALPRGAKVSTLVFEVEEQDMGQYLIKM